MALALESPLRSAECDVRCYGPLVVCCGVAIEDRSCVENKAIGAGRHSTKCDQRPVHVGGVDRCLMAAAPATAHEASSLASLCPGSCISSVSIRCGNCCGNS